MVGYPSAWDDGIVRGDPSEGRFTVVYAKDGRAVLMINDDEHFDARTKLVETRHSVTGSLADRDAPPLQAATM
jgi:hypothetical protein